MIELFSRRPVSLDLPDHAIYRRVPVNQDIVCLSEVLLDDAYFEALQSARRQVDGVTIIDEMLLRFRARAFLDLSARAEAGDNVKRNDTRKHRNDVSGWLSYCRRMQGPNFRSPSSTTSRPPSIWLALTIRSTLEHLALPSPGRDSRSSLPILTNVAGVSHPT